MIGHQGFEITYRTSSGELQLSFSCFVKFQKYLTFIFLALHVGLERKKSCAQLFLRSNGLGETVSKLI